MQMKSLFKRLLEHALFTFITLLIFFACVMLSIKTWELFEDRSYNSSQADEFEYSYSPDELAKDLQLHSIKTEPNADLLTISGRLQNSSTTHWKMVSLDVIYYVEDIEMGRCSSAYVEDVKPGQSYYFSSNCQLNTNRLPSKFSYKVLFSSGQRITKTEQSRKNNL
jgi:hypothetical protein